jgi:glutamate synthase (ferredoxin)
MSPERRAFYDYHSSLMEPWDGPASIAFTDGTVIGAVLDRNGLRPSRYYVTKDDLVIMASEVGVLDIPPENVLLKERLHPGRIFLVDTAQGRIIDDDEIKAELAAERPYGAWLQQHQVHLDDVAPAHVSESDHATILTRQIAFGYTHEDARLLLAPMARQGEEPIGSMGTDTSLAVLSDRSRPLYDYFKQLFAQVTNPPLDQIREELVTAMESTIGPERNLSIPSPSPAGRSCSRTRCSRTKGSPSSCRSRRSGSRRSRCRCCFASVRAPPGSSAPWGSFNGAPARPSPTDTTS